MDGQLQMIDGQDYGHRDILWHLRRRLTDDQLTRLRGLASCVWDTFARHGIPVFLYAGNLLAVMRNNGSIPWDDEVDAIALMSRRGAEEIMPRLFGRMALKKNPDLWAVFDPDDPPAGRWPWKAPFVDIHIALPPGIHEGHLFPARCAEWEGVPVLIPNRSTDVLDILWSEPDWRISVPSPCWNHLQECHNPPGAIYSILEEVEVSGLATFNLKRDEDFPIAIQPLGKSFLRPDVSTEEGLHLSPEGTKTARTPDSPGVVQSVTTTPPEGMGETED